MKITNILFHTILFSISIPCIAQVDVDKSIQLTGTDGNRMITNLEAPVNPTDAVNKAYFDASAGGSQT